MSDACQSDVVEDVHGLDPSSGSLRPSTLNTTPLNHSTCVFVACRQKLQDIFVAPLPDSGPLVNFLGSLYIRVAGGGGGVFKHYPATLL